LAIQFYNRYEEYVFTDIGENSILLLNTWEELYHG
jgi:hypothetical protein